MVFVPPDGNFQGCDEIHNRKSVVIWLEKSNLVREISEGKIDSSRDCLATLLPYGIL